MSSYNIDRIRNRYETFLDCKKSFQNNYYSDFKSSYIYTSNDQSIAALKSKLEQFYSKLNRAYNNIDIYWSQALTDIETADNAMAGKASTGSINDSTVASLIRALPELPEYSNTAATLFGSGLASATGTAHAVDEWVQWAQENPEEAKKQIENVVERTCATVATVVTSAVEGIVKLAEDIVDLAFIVGAAVDSVFTGAADLISYAVSKMTGDESARTHYTKDLWDNTRAIVSTNYTKTAFDSIYANTKVGAWIKNNAYAFDTVRAVTNEVAEVIGVTVLSTVTGGSAAVIYGAAKTAEHTETNWQDENMSTALGLFKGTGQGIADGVFFAIGSKGDAIAKAGASSVAAKIGEKTASTFIQSLGKSGVLVAKMGFEAGTAIAQDATSVTFDAVFSPDTIVDAQGKTITFNNLKEKYNYYFEQYGGNEAFIQSAITAGVLSGLSDAKDIKNAEVDATALGALFAGRKLGKNIPTSKIDIEAKKVNVETELKAADYDKLKTEYETLLKKSQDPEWKYYKELGDNGGAGNLNKIQQVSEDSLMMEELETKLGIKTSNIPESESYLAASKNKAEADELAREINQKPIPALEKYNIDTSSPEYKKVMSNLYAKPSPSGKQDLSKIVNPFDDIKKQQKVDSFATRVNNILKNKDGKINFEGFKKPKKVFADYNGNLKNYIFDDFPKNLSEVEKARYIYCKLNNEVSYSAKWNSQSKVRIDTDTIYHNKVDLSNYNGEDIICSNWSQMYSDLLKEAGIPCEIRGSDMKHRWVVFADSKGKYYFADATNTFFRANDIARTQGGIQSLGFMEISYDEAMSNDFANYKADVFDASKKSNINLAKIDKKIGFNYEDANKLFGTELQNKISPRELKKFGLSKDASTTQIIEAKLEQDVFQKINNMGVMEGLQYAKATKNTRFNTNELQNLNESWIIDRHTGNMSVLYKVTDGKNYLYSGKGTIREVDDNFANNYTNYGFIDY